MSLVMALKRTAECCGVRLLIMMLSSLKSSIDLRSILEVMITLISCTPWSISDKSILKSFRSLRMRSSALSITSSILSRIASLLMIRFNVVMLNYFCWLFSLAIPKRTGLSAISVSLNFFKNCSETVIFLALMYIMPPLIKLRSEM